MGRRVPASLQDVTMYKDLKFPVLIVHRDIKADTVAGDRVRAIAQELTQDGFSLSLIHI